jgi:hypothetical protein
MQRADHKKHIKKACFKLRSAERSKFRDYSDASDFLLSEIITKWPDLPNSVKERILTLVRLSVAIETSDD